MEEEVIWFISNLLVAIITIILWVVIRKVQKLAEDKKQLAIEAWGLLENYKHMFTKARIHRFWIIDWRDLWQDCFQEAKSKFKFEGVEKLTEDELLLHETHKLVSETEKVGEKLYWEWRSQMDDLFSKLMMLNGRSFLFGDWDQKQLSQLLKTLYTDVYNRYIVSMDKYVQYCFSWQWNIDQGDSEEWEKEYNTISDTVFFTNRTSEYGKNWQKMFDEIFTILKKHIRYDIIPFKFE